MTDWLYWFLRRVYFMICLNTNGDGQPPPGPLLIEPQEELSACPESTDLPIDMSGIEFEDDEWEAVQ